MTADNGIDLGKRQHEYHQEVSEISDSIKILHEPHHILGLGGQLLVSADKEILISVSSANTFLRQSKSGILKRLFDGKMITGTVRILTPINDLVFNVLEGVRKKYPNIEVKTTEEPDLQIQMTILVVDRRSCLVIELKDDSKPIPEEAMGTAMYTTSGPTVMSYFTIFETLWKQSELYAKLRAHENAQREFINTAAHELRTPIQPILGLSEALLMNEKYQDLTPYHNIILRNARRLKKLAENILDVAKIEANTVRLNKEAVDLHSLITEAIENFQHQVADYSQIKKQGEGGSGHGQATSLESQKNVKIILSPDVKILQSQGSGPQQQPASSNNHISVINGEPENEVSSSIPLPPLPSSPLIVMVDPERISQVLNNLINNALWSVTCGCNNENNDRKVDGLAVAAEDSNKIRYIELSTQKDVEHNNVIVSVADNGEGISQDLFPKLFTKFATKDDRGLGLGLYICKGIVEAHGGTIWAENKHVGNTNGDGDGHSGGAVFRFTLPLQET